MIRETAIQFGAGARLVGILTEPPSGTLRACFGLVTVAFNPKFGPFRIYAEWARHLATQGIATLRFDLGGLGESVPLREGNLRNRTRLEVGLAADVLSSRFPGLPISLGGICSGAEDSLRYAEEDPRVRGVVLVDPFAYRTAGWAWRHSLFRLRRRMLRAIGLWKPGSILGEESIVAYQVMEREESHRILTTLLARQTRLHFIYTSGRRETFNHRSQFQKMFPDLPPSGHLTVDWLPTIEHSQVLREDRELLIETVATRMSAVDAT
jgi:pimeloyl-ACP methyl ester carboxylesterase